MAHAFPVPLIRLFLVLAAASLPVWAGYHSLETVAGLHHLADSANPYFVVEQALLLYLVTPIVVLSTFVLMLAPGLCLALVIFRPVNVGEWILTGFIISLVVLSVALGIGQSLHPDPWTGSGPLLLISLCGIAAFAVLLGREMIRPGVNWPWQHEGAVNSLVSMAVVPLLILVSLLPKFFWETFNGDGAHAFESARLLLVQAVPFWPPEAGGIAGFPDVSSFLFAYPMSWFIRIFGWYEFSARLPYLLFLVPLFGALLALSSVGRKAPTGRFYPSLIWLGLIIYTVVMAFSATYDPYSADIALPATQDTLLMVCWLGAILGFLRKWYAWTVLCTFLACISLPSGALLAVFWMMCSFLMLKPRPWLPTFFMAGGLVIYMLFRTWLPGILETFEIPAPGNEYGAANVLTRFESTQFADWKRLAFIAVPCGILPFLTLFMWPRLDPVARAFSLVTVLYFLLFYVQASVSLHHFVPAMLIPLVVFWRTLSFMPDGRQQKRWMAASAVLGLAALWLSLPLDFAPRTHARAVGSEIELRTGQYEASDPTVFSAASLLSRLFPVAAMELTPQSPYGGSPLIWNYYAFQPREEGTEINYLVIPANETAPAGMTRLQSSFQFSLYVRNTDRWQDHARNPPGLNPGSPVYAIPRSVLFGFGRK